MNGICVDMRCRDGFSLVELCVVMAIMAMCMAMIAVSTNGSLRSAQVRAAAEQLAADLRRARQMAIAERCTIGVAFNIANAPDSSGAVLNNRSGGHWYRIIGPGRGAILDQQTVRGSIPYAAGGGFTRVWNFPDLLAEIRGAWRGQPIVLPAGKVRFLALADTDEGPRRRLTSPASVGTVWYGSGGETTYPRPWFGTYLAGRLHPWGGYDSGRAGSGFFYQGAGGPVVGCRNPLSITYDNDFNRDGVFADSDADGDGTFLGERERERGVAVLRAGEDRPLVNADWLDVCIVFHPSGEAQMLEPFRNRRFYQETQAPPVSGVGMNGVRSMCKGVSGRSGMPGYTDRDGTYSIDVPEMGSFDRHTGGWHLTLAPDVLDDRVDYPDAHQALSALQPAWRVFVGRWGSIRAFPVRYRKDAIDGRHVWPTDPTQWTSVTATSANPVWSRCRMGWLHAVRTVNSSPTGSLADFVPVGRPLSDVVCERMLAERVWWIDE